MEQVARVKLPLMALAVAALLLGSMGAMLGAAVLVGAVAGIAGCAFFGLGHDAPAVADQTVAELPPQVDISRLRHDLNGILSPAMLTADRLLAHGDPAVQRAGQIMATTVERAAARLAETKVQGEQARSGAAG
jgi:hypothetical protein